MLKILPKKYSLIVSAPLSPKTVKFGDHDLLKQQQALFAFPQQQQRSESEQAIIILFKKI